MHSLFLLHVFVFCRYNVINAVVGVMLNVQMSEQKNFEMSITVMNFDFIVNRLEVFIRSYLLTNCYNITNTITVRLIYLIS